MKINYPILSVSADIRPTTREELRGVYTVVFGGPVANLAEVADRCSFCWWNGVGKMFRAQQEINAERAVCNAFVDFLNANNIPWYSFNLIRAKVTEHSTGRTSARVTVIFHTDEADE